MFHTVRKFGFELSALRCLQQWSTACYNAVGISICSGGRRRTDTVCSCWMLRCCLQVKCITIKYKLGAAVASPPPGAVGQGHMQGPLADRIGSSCCFDFHMLRTDVTDVSRVTSDVVYSLRTVYTRTTVYCDAYLTYDYTVTIKLGRRPRRKALEQVARLRSQNRILILYD